MHSSCIVDNELILCFIENDFLLRITSGVRGYSIAFGNFTNNEIE